MNKKISKIKCSICKQDGHNKRTCKIITIPISATNIEPNNEVKTEMIIEVKTDTNIELKTKMQNDIKIILPLKVDTMVEDSYSEELLKEQFELHKSYVIGRINTTIKIGVKVRLPSIPEDISENIVKKIIHNKLNDKTSRWDCKTGDLESKKEGKQECKCFISDGPLSFTPMSDWDVIYFLDARKWLDDIFILYKVILKRTSTEWKNIKVNKTQTFEDQTKQGRRPRLTWDYLQPQIKTYCNKVYEGTFNNIFIPLEVMG